MLPLINDTRLQVDRKRAKFKTFSKTINIKVMKMSKRTKVEKNKGFFVSPKGNH